MSHEKVRIEIGLAVVALSPFILRAVGHTLFDCLLQKYCKMNTKELKEHLKGTENTSLSIKNIWNKEDKISWSEARDAMGINNCAAIFIASIRLLFWHWLQVASYAIFLYGYWDLLYNAQQILGLIVLVREAIYFIFTIVCIFMNPVYLLPDYKASWNESKRNVLIYIFAPEKFVFFSCRLHTST